jgi:hypothetical protein
VSRASLVRQLGTALFYSLRRGAWLFLRLPDGEVKPSNWRLHGTIGFFTFITGATAPGF